MKSPQKFLSVQNTDADTESVLCIDEWPQALALVHKSMDKVPRTGCRFSGFRCWRYIFGFVWI